MHQGTAGATKITLPVLHTSNMKIFSRHISVQLPGFDKCKEHSGQGLSEHFDMVEMTKRLPKALTTYLPELEIVERLNKIYDIFGDEDFVWDLVSRSRDLVERDRDLWGSFIDKEDSYMDVVALERILSAAHIVASVLPGGSYLRPFFKRCIPIDDVDILSSGGPTPYHYDKCTCSSSRVILLPTHPHLLRASPPKASHCKPLPLIENSSALQKKIQLFLGLLSACTCTCNAFSALKFPRLSCGMPSCACGLLQQNVCRGTAKR